MLKELRSKYAAKLAEAKGLVPEGSAITPELAEKVNAILSEADEIKRQIDLVSRIHEGDVFLTEPAQAPRTLTQPAAGGSGKGFGSFGEFLKTAIQVERGVLRGDERLDEIKATGLSEGIPSEGGFLVQKDQATDLLKPIYNTGAIASRIDLTGISAASNGMTFNGIDEVSRATGSRFGGIQAYWAAEAATKTKSKPTFKQIELKLKKLIGLAYLTDELLNDAPALQAVVTEAFNLEFRFMIENSVYNGSGVGQPLGFMNSAAKITVAKEANQPAATIVSENVMKMWSRMYAPSRANAVWFVNQDVEPQLFAMYLAVGLGGIPVYMPANGLSGSPYGTLMGRPVIPVEYAATLGTEGDIVLADLSQYKAIDKGGVEQSSSIHVQFLTDETALRFVYRFDGLPKWHSALTPFKGTNTQSPFITLATRA